MTVVVIKCIHTSANVRPNTRTHTLYYNTNTIDNIQTWMKIEMLVASLSKNIRNCYVYYKFDVKILIKVEPIKY